MGSPFYDYKDKVNYDYIINVKAKFYYDKELSDSEANEVDSQIEKEIDNLFTNEDYMKQCFPELGLGRVYASVNEVNGYTNVIDIQIGLSLQDLPKDSSVKKVEDSIKDNVEALLNDLHVNIDNSAKIYREDDDPSKDAKVIYVHPEQIEKEDIEIKITKNLKESIKDIDRLLVTEGVLYFKSRNKINENRKLELNDDCNIIVTDETESLIENIPFSKASIQKIYEELLDNNFILLEDNDEYDDAINNMKQGIEKVDQLQALKDELQSKVDNLVSESKSFPTSNECDKLISSSDNIQLDQILNDEQKNWIQENCGSLEEIQEAFQLLLNMVDTEKPFISISDYINQISKED